MASLLPASGPLGMVQDWTGHNILAVSLSSFSYWIILHQIWLHSLTHFLLFTLVFISIQH